MIGASLLWVGWFGFNAGSAVGANGRAGMAMAVTQIATAAAALGWMFAEWIAKGKPSVLGAISGAVAGLVAITPASGFVLPGRRIIIGIAAGVICFWAATSAQAHARLRRQPGCVRRALHRRHRRRAADRRVRLRPAVCDRRIAGRQSRAALRSSRIQCEGVVATLVYSGVGTLIMLMVTKVLVGLRVDRGRGARRPRHRAARRTDLLTDRLTNEGLPRNRRPSCAALSNSTR